MAKTAVRGTKRWCQDEVCALPFYDLNRAAYCCPNCGANYDLRIARSLAVASQPAPARYPRVSPVLRSKPMPTPEAEPEPEAEPAQSSEEEVDAGESGDAGATETLIEDDDEDSIETVPRNVGSLTG